MTHKGLHRYKRLNFGISCAPENYNKIITQVFQGLEGVNNIFDDIVVHAATYEEHIERVEKVLERLEQNGLTVNEDKCQFCMPSNEFMGHLLSEHGTPSIISTKWKREPLRTDITKLRIIENRQISFLFSRRWDELA